MHSRKSNCVKYTTLYFVTYLNTYKLRFGLGFTSINHLTQRSCFIKGSFSDILKNLKYSELELWTNFCPFYRLGLYGEWPVVKITHTSFGELIKNTSRSKATYSRLHETSCYSIYNVLELAGFLPEIAVTSISYSPSMSRGGDPCCPLEMTSAPWEVPQDKAALGQALQGHLAQHSPCQQRDLPPYTAPRQGMNTRLMPHIPDLEMLVGKLREEPLPEEVPYCTSYLRSSHHSPQMQWEKEVEAKSPQL